MRRTRAPLQIIDDRLVCPQCHRRQAEPVTEDPAGEWECFALIDRWHSAPRLCGHRFTPTDEALAERAARRGCTP